MEKRINQGKQTEYVKRSIINYISDHGLQFGERIPTQFELRQRLGGGNAVISRAIQTLIEDGILENRGRNGVVVHNPHVEGYEGRNIGLICHRDLEFTSMATQMQAIGIELNKHACQMTLFIKSNQESKDVFELREFRGAQRAVLQHKIDALISTVLLSHDSVEFCRQNNVPLCYVGISKPNAPGVIHNLNIPKLLKNVKERGFTRPLLVHMGHPDTAQLKEDFLSKS
ncbi:MAG: GntR family transcriptional regulator, partial [Lentisphaeria bacterium]